MFRHFVFIDNDFLNQTQQGILILNLAQSSNSIVFDKFKDLI